MLLKIPSFEIDEVERVKNIRLNIPNKSQFRLKCTLLNGDIEKDIDIAAREFKCKLSGMTTVTANIIGVDMISKLTVNLTFSFNLLNKEKRLKGVAGNKNLDVVFNTLGDVKQLCDQLM